MKVLLLLIVIILAAMAGYLVEPSMRLQLTGKSAKIEKFAPKSKQRTAEVLSEPVTPVIPVPPMVNSTPEPNVELNPEVVDFEAPVTPSKPDAPVVPVAEQPEALTQTADVVLVMKASLASGQISKFNASQVLEWEAGTGTEVFDGQTYQVGNVKYQAETPFGTKNLPAKALIKDGKVVRWISPKSGMQIE